MADNKKSSIGGKSTCHLLNIKQPERTGKRLKVSFQRTKAILHVLKMNKIIESSMSLLDISEVGAGFFTSELLLKGSTVEVCITEPRLLKLKGIVAWSVPVSSNIYKASLSFRTGVQFIYDNEMQRTSLVEFIKRVQVDAVEGYRMSQALAAQNP